MLLGFKWNAYSKKHRDYNSAKLIITSSCLQKSRSIKIKIFSKYFYFYSKLLQSRSSNVIVTIPESKG